MKVTNELVEALKCDRRICAAFLIGSAVSDRMCPGSDVDGQKLDDMESLNETGNT